MNFLSDWEEQYVILISFLPQEHKILYRHADEGVYLCQ